MRDVLESHTEMIEHLRCQAGDLNRMADVMEEWRCPDCGGVVTLVTEELAATYVYGKTEAARISLAHGIDPGPPETEVRPVSFDLTFGCENGHEHYVRTRSAS